MSAWFQDETFWETFEPILFNEERVALARIEAEKVAGLLGLTPGAKLLDLCCGVGRHSVEFARQGFSVTGVDLNQAYLDRARSRAEAENLAIEFVQSDMRDFIRARAFDGAVNLFTSLGYFDDPADNLRVLTNVHTSLKAGARFVIDVLGKEILARIFQERVWRNAPDGSLILEEHHLRSGWDRIENRWILIKGDRREEFSFSHWLYSGAELAAMLRQAGFREVQLYGSLSRTPYDHRAERLVAVSVK
ncbi:MAG TPA: methyltransferase domain-containing protein [Candidatus Binataceae bacterium]|nr:methyltransferase domain-containing protein [Candidatus Binataceae bacterium]